MLVLPSAEKQSVYSSTLADWAWIYLRCWNKLQACAQKTNKCVFWSFNSTFINSGMLFFFCGFPYGCHVCKLNLNWLNTNKINTGLVWFGLVWFYGILTIVGYSMPNPVYTYIIRLDICLQIRLDLYARSCQTLVWQEPEKGNPVKP